MSGQNHSSSKKETKKVMSGNGTTNIEAQPYFQEDELILK